MESTAEIGGRGGGEDKFKEHRSETPGAKILLVEDELIIAEDLKRRLTRMGHVVAAIVSTGELAVARAAEIRPDLVVMDISLNGELDGVAAAMAIQEACNASVVYVTGHGDSETMKRAKVTEGFSVVLKPIDDGELLYMIEMALHRRNLGGKGVGA